MTVRKRFYPKNFEKLFKKHIFGCINILLLGMKRTKPHKNII
jgi:hypothetical protein